jgi:hypothetical protein
MSLDNFQALALIAIAVGASTLIVLAIFAYREDQRDEPQRKRPKSAA